MACSEASNLPSKLLSVLWSGEGEDSCAQTREFALWAGKSPHTKLGKSQRVSLGVLRVQSIKCLSTIPVVLCIHPPCYLLPCIPSTLLLTVPVPEQLSQIQHTVMWALLVLQLWHDLQKCPHLRETPLFFQFYCFALVRLSILCAHWYQQDVHEASGQFFGGVPRVIKSPISYPIDKTSEVVSEHAKSFCLAPCSWRSSFCLVAEVEKTGTSGDDSGTWGSFHHCWSLARLSIFAVTNAFWIWSSLMLRA